MSFSKIKIGQEEIFEVIIKDLDNKVLENWKCMKRDFHKVCKILNNKFGLNMIIRERRDNVVDRDLDWAK